MPSKIETTNTGPGKTTTKWYSGVLTPQTVILVCAGFVSMVIFWKDSKDNWEKVKHLEEKVEKKSDDADLKSLSERVNRQYETNSKIQERIVEVEKQLEYERGRREERERQADR